MQAIRKKHFNSIFTFLQDNKFDLRAYDKVIFTDGVVHLYKDFFDAREDKNFEVLEDGQTANVRGYNEFGNTLLVRKNKRYSRH
ncbi:hypothetical protein [Priestia taiwanensis]|uniref:Uncharacterized protein n=1 Tax=Priestia taiwanensis TaxID=1347902 RepID=A0A917AVG8_9BACI|nr:hypothetical protein [Priestia taiwanensis]MBM7364655.1 hypothetical protein [Priestia taiwanensis]GGE78559.1 hypothetical protein GCM10007140_30200 [Priestia taiwanensis]